jgi:hypothetical protein
MNGHIRKEARWNRKKFAVLLRMLKETGMTCSRRAGANAKRDGQAHEKAGRIFTLIKIRPAFSPNAKDDSLVKTFSVAVRRSDLRSGAAHNGV